MTSRRTEHQTFSSPAWWKRIHVDQNVARDTGNGAEGDERGTADTAVYAAERRAREDAG